MTHRHLATLVATSALALGALGNAAQADTRHTSLSEFDACLPLEDGRVVAASGGGLVLVDKNDRVQQVFTALDGLPATRSHALALSDEGLWVGTERGAALVSLDANTIKVKKRVKSKAVRDLLVRDQTVYLGTWGQGVLEVRGEELRRLPRSKRSWKQRVTSLEWSDGALVWGSAGKGLWTHRKGRARRVSGIPADAMIWDVQRMNDALWIAGGEAVWRKGESLRSHDVHGVRALSSQGNDIYLASFGSGLRTLSSPTMVGPQTPFLRSLNRREGTRCAGGQDSLWIDRGEGWSSVELPSSLPGNDISALALQGDKVAVGSFDHGVAIIEKGEIQKIAPRMDPHVNALAWDVKDGSLWIATSTGLVHWKKGRAIRFSKSEGLPSRHVMSLDALPSGGVLVGTAAGAATVADGDVIALGGKGGLGTGNVWAVAHGPDGSHWLGTTRGLWRLRGDRIDRFRLASGHLPEDWVMAVEATDTGVFVGTYKSGVIRFDVDGNEVSSAALGPGWVNPGGLHWDGRTLRASSMYGAFEGDGQSATWKKGPKGLGRDTTAYLVGEGGERWVASRRGLRKLSAAAK